MEKMMVSKIIGTVAVLTVGLLFMAASTPPPPSAEFRSFVVGVLVSSIMWFVLPEIWKRPA